LGNANSGVYIEGAPNNTIGGDTESARNVISGNNLSGISIYSSGATGNLVQGNYIGTQANGTEALSNSWSGVYISDAPSNTVGGTTAGTRNIISGNTIYGVSMRGSSTTGNVVQGNYIGTGIAGTESLGNHADGINVRSSASGNRIGGSSPNESNLIAHSGRDGIRVAAGINNLISRNSISSNTGLGINLGSDGVTSNDPGDSDTGANNLQNFPVLTSVTVAGGNTTIQGTLNSTADTTFNLEFFYSMSANPSGHGEGSVFIGSYAVTTDETGNTSFTASFPTEIPGGSFVSATATDPDDNTSEFSLVRDTPTAVTLSDFYARPGPHYIVLEWTTVVEIETLGFNLYRAEQVDGTRTTLNDTLIISLAPGSSSGAHYIWTDDDVTPNVTCYYWLEDIDVYGTASTHGPVSATATRYLYYLPLIFH